MQYYHLQTVQNHAYTNHPVELIEIMYKHIFEMNAAMHANPRIADARMIATEAKVCADLSFHYTFAGNAKRAEETCNLRDLYTSMLLDGDDKSDYSHHFGKPAKAKVKTKVKAKPAVKPRKDEDFDPFFLEEFFPDPDSPRFRARFAHA